MRSKTIVGIAAVSTALFFLGCDDKQKAQLDKAGDDIGDSAKQVGDSTTEEVDKVIEPSDN
ncbi:MAG: hypothetical protein P8J86_00235 [Phycisphaerales bacterium]|nr:hypothetical protein [Phycisphaerales bacterium]